MKLQIDISPDEAFEAIRVLPDGALKAAISDRLSSGVMDSLHSEAILYLAPGEKKWRRSLVPVGYIIRGHLEGNFIPVGSTWKYATNPEAAQVNDALLDAAKAYHKQNLASFKGDRSEWARAYKRASTLFLDWLSAIHSGKSVEEANKEAA